jgi:2-polyprenyl-3-methyl-5-hydroxy-6-metoxy-1,4-benzoquinol methylase
VADVAMTSVRGGLQSGLDHMLAVGYGTLYDYIFERFPPYQRLRSEVLGLVQAEATDERGRVRVLDLGCGPGNFSLMLAEAGFSVVGVDAYAPLITLAQEKRRAQRLSNLAFKHGDLVRGEPFPPEQFDQVINVHFLYAHPDPAAVLRAAYRVLKPGGHAIFVNLTRRVAVWATLRDMFARHGLVAALNTLLWVLPNTIFETVRRQTGPHYWDEQRMTDQLRGAGFELVALRRTFFDDASLLATVRRPATVGVALAASPPILTARF